MAVKTRKFQTNSSQNPARVMIQCRTAVNRDAVRRESIDGVEHIIVSSATLPDDVVMNGGLYPAEEIAKSFESLDLTLAPIEHPQINGQFISANDPRAIHDFHAGAFNMNVRREDGRVWVDKYINVAEARKSDRGKRLLDRIDELENNSDPRPIHTSVGVFVLPEELEEPQTNAAGDEFTWIAREMVFDHDAILLDSVGAAQPHQGVGVAVNRKGEECRVDQFTVNAVTASRRLPLAPSDTVWNSSEADKRVREAIGAEDEPNATYGRYHLWFDEDQAENFGAYKLPFVDIIDGRAHAVPNALRNAAARLGQTDGPTDVEKERIRSIIDSYLNELRDNSASFSELHRSVMDALEKSAIDADWIEELFTDRVIFWSKEDLFEVPFVVDDQGIATIVGVPLPVERNVTFTPKTNHSEGDAMRELMLNALAAAGITVNADISDADLLAQYNALQADQSDSDGGGAGDDKGIAEVVANAVAEATKPLTAQIEGLQAKMNSADDAELDRLADLVGNSDKFPGLDVEGAKKLGVDTLKSMAANCAPAFGVSPLVNAGQSGADERFSAPSDMPE